MPKADWETVITTKDQQKAARVAAKKRARKRFRRVLNAFMADLREQGVEGAVSSTIKIRQTPEGYRTQSWWSGSCTITTWIGDIERSVEFKAHCLPLEDVQTGWNYYTWVDDDSEPWGDCVEMAARRLGPHCDECDEEPESTAVYELGVKTGTWTYQHELCEACADAYRDEE